MKYAPRRLKGYLITHQPQFGPGGWILYPEGHDHCSGKGKNRQKKGTCQKACASAPKVSTSITEDRRKGNSE
jgi:hypothetical protein